MKIAKTTTYFYCIILLELKAIVRNIALFIIVIAKYSEVVFDF